MKFPSPGLKPTSPSLAGRFFTSGSSRKSAQSCYMCFLPSLESSFPLLSLSPLFLLISLRQLGNPPPGNPPLDSQMRSDPLVTDSKTSCISAFQLSITCLPHCAISFPTAYSEKCLTLRQHFLLRAMSGPSLKKASRNTCHSLCSKFEKCFADSLYRNFKVCARVRHLLSLRHLLLCSSHTGLLAFSTVVKRNCHRTFAYAVSSAKKTTRLTPSFPSDLCSHVTLSEPQGLTYSTLICVFQHHQGISDSQQTLIGCPTN